MLRVAFRKFSWDFHGIAFSRITFVCSGERGRQIRTDNDGQHQKHVVLRDRRRRLFLAGQPGVQIQVRLELRQSQIDVTTFHSEID